MRRSGGDNVIRFFVLHEKGMLTGGTMIETEKKKAYIDIVRVDVARSSSMRIFEENTSVVIYKIENKNNRSLSGLENSSASLQCFLSVP